MSSSESAKVPVPPPREGIDFESLPWNLNEPSAQTLTYIRITGKTPKSFDEVVGTAHKSSEELLAELKSDTYLKSYSEPLQLTPSTTSLNYGTTVWEGLKCYRISDTEAVVFRADRNWKRMCNGAAAMCLPAPSYKLFMTCVQAVLQANADLIPPVGEGMKLYVRPMLLGSGQQLGLYPSPEMTFLMYVSPTGSYFKGRDCGLRLRLETQRCRAARGGTGSVKCCGNYGTTLFPLKSAKAAGLDDNLYLELETLRDVKNLDAAVIQELSAANIFAVLDNGEIVTPSLERKTLLPGVTRDSILRLAEYYADGTEDDILVKAMKDSTGNDSVSVKVSERDVTVADLRRAREVFVTGTAVGITAVGSVTATDPEVAPPLDVEFAFGMTLPGGPVTVALIKIFGEVACGKRTCGSVTANWIPNLMAPPAEFRGEAPSLED